MSRFLIFAILTMLPVWGHAITQAECGYVDMSDRFVGPRDQGSSGLCYSFAAADLLSEAAAVKPPNSISAYGVVMQYINLTKDEAARATKSIQIEDAYKETSLMLNEPDRFRFTDPIERMGGITSLAMAVTIDHKTACLESEVPSQAIMRGSDNPEEYFFLRNRLGGMRPDESPFFPMPLLPHSIKDAVTAQQMPGCALRDLDKNRVTNEKSLKLITDMSPVMQDWAALKLRSAAMDECKTKITIPSTISTHSKSFGEKSNPEESASTMLNLLDRKRPFEIDLDMCLFKDHCDHSPAPDHGVVVVGKSWNPKTAKCELKIKNSWGIGCDNAVPHGPKCVNGYWFVDTDKIAGTKPPLTWLEK